MEGTGLLVLGENKLLLECLASRLRGEGLEVTSWHAPIGPYSPLQPAPQPGRDSKHPEVVLIDLSGSDAGDLSVVEAAREQYPNAGLVVHGLRPQRHEIARCVATVVEGGYLSVSSPLSELTEAIQSVQAGDTFVSPSLAAIMFNAVSELATELDRRRQSDAYQLSSRELQILGHVHRGLSNGEIASALHLSVHTVKNHVHRILEKLQVSDRREAARYAQERRWFPPEPSQVGPF